MLDMINVQLKLWKLHGVGTLAINCCHLHQLLLDFLLVIW